MLLLNRGDDFSFAMLLPLMHGEKVERLGSCHLVCTVTSAGSRSRLHHLGAIVCHSLVKSPDAIVSTLESLVLQVV